MNAFILGVCKAGGNPMCCIRIETSELLANIYGSPHVSREFEADVRFLTDICQYLNDVLPGYIYFDLDELEMEAVAKMYPQFYEYQNGVIKGKDHIPLRTRFNEIYPQNIAKLIMYSIDMYLKPVPV